MPNTRAISSVTSRSMLAAFSLVMPEKFIVPTSDVSVMFTWRALPAAVPVSKSF